MTTERMAKLEKRVDRLYYFFYAIGVAWAILAAFGINQFFNIRTISNTVEQANKQSQDAIKLANKASNTIADRINDVHKKTEEGKKILSEKAFELQEDMISKSNIIGNEFLGALGKKQIIFGQV